MTFDEEDDPGNGDLVTKQDLERVENRLEQKIDGVENKLDRRVDGLDIKLEIVAMQVGVLTGQMTTLREDVGTLREGVGALREEVSRDIAHHVNAGFEMMRQLFGVQDDRAKSIEDKHGVLRRELTEHTQDFVLYCKA